MKKTRIEHNDHLDTVKGSFRPIGQKAVLCPVCQGEGMVRNPDYLSQNTYAGEPKKTCHGCGGRGWVAV